MSNNTTTATNRTKVAEENARQSLEINSPVNGSGDEFKFEVRSRMEARHWSATALGFVILVMLSLSLTHLANGLHTLTGDSSALSIALAVGIDCSVVATEIALVVAALKSICGVKGMARVILVTTLSLSGILNGLSLVGDKSLLSFSGALCAALGAFIPFTVFGLSKVAAALLVGKVDAEIPQEFSSLDDVRVAERIAKRTRRKSERLARV